MKFIQPSWPPPPPDISFKTDQVHVWCASLDQPIACITRLAKVLSKDEQERANRFIFDKDQHHFIVARANLRLILSLYLKTEADQLRFRYGPQGKPELTGINDDSLYFNISHSHGLALFAVALDRTVGVDLELVRPLDDMDSIAQRFFSTEEYTAYRTLPPDEKPLGFFNCWTRKEAYIKAIGEGLSHPLTDFVVSIRPDQPAKLLHTKNNPEAAKDWSMLALAPAFNYVGAVVIEGQKAQISCWHWKIELAKITKI